MDKTLAIMRECPICLETILATALLGRIQGCLHTYHEQCLIQWSTHSNSCPTCRKLFYGVDIVDGIQPNLIRRSVPVKDKIIENDAINHIPPEYIIPPQVYTETRPDDSDRTQNGVCMVCSSAQYSRRNRPMVSCIGCGAKFHTLCLGHRDEPEWFCPVCDCCQEISVQVISHETRRNVVSARRGLTIFNENDEIEDFDDRDELIRTSSVLNGGVLLRREARQRENLTKDEADSWSALEQVRLGTVSDSEKTQSPDPASSRKKRRRHREPPGLPSSTLLPMLLLLLLLLLTSTNTVVSSASDKPSRIVSLMNQIKSGSTTLIADAARMIDNRVKGLDPGIAINIDLRASLPKSPTIPTELSFDQKKKIQKYVRDKLRPRYDPHSGSSDPEIIKTEQEYIEINKAISRKVYAEVLSLFVRESEDVMEDFFAREDAKLREMVNVHADGVIGRCQ